MQEPIRDRFEIQYFKCQSNPVSLNTYLSNLRFISRTLQINLYTSLSISCVLRQHYMNNSGFQLLHIHKLVSMDLKISGIFNLIIRKRLFFLSAIAYKTTVQQSILLSHFLMNYLTQGLGQLERTESNLVTCLANISLN